MAIIIEDGTGKSDAEAYISVADTTAYHDARGNSVWASADLADQESALRKAAEYIDYTFGPRWKGDRTNATQALDWPRFGVYVDGVLIDSDELPKQLVQACAELALIALSEDLTPSLPRGGEVKATTVKVGPITRETEYSDGARRRTEYPVATDRLRRLVTGATREVRSDRG